MDQKYKRRGKSLPRPLPKLYGTWVNMRTRCYGKSYIHYNDWGGRGIRICDSWMDDFYKFEEDMLPTYSNGLTLDRIDNNGNYEPSNCRWISRAAQNSNKRSNVILEYGGFKGTMKQIADEYGIKKKTLWQRLNTYGWSVEKSLLTPARRRI